MEKELYLKNLPALYDVIGQLPDDVSIIRIYDDYKDGKDRMCMQIGERKDIVPDRVDSLSIAGMDWAEKDYIGLFGPMQATVAVGWCIHNKEDEDDDL